MGLAEHTGLSGQKTRRGRRQRLAFIIFMICVGVPTLLFSLILPYPISAVLMTFCALILALVIFGTYVDKMLSTFGGFVVLIAGAIYVIGILDGISDSVGPIQMASNVHNLQLKGAEPKQIMLLRSFEKGALIRTPADDQIEFIRWDQVVKLSHRISMDLQPNGCRWLKLFCLDVIIP